MLSSNINKDTNTGNESLTGALSLCRTMLFSALASASVLLCGQLSADDTEIFFADELGTSDSTANVLFMFDTSGSMSFTDSVGISRLSRLKDAMISVVESSQNVNIGIGSFGGDNLGSIQLPAVGVDEDICANGACKSLKLRGEIRHIDDDAQGYSDGSVELNDAALEVSNNASLWALRFDDLNIPRGATINSARLQIISRGVYTNNTSLSIVAEATDNSDPLTTENNNLADRLSPGAATSPPVIWNTGDWDWHEYYSFDYFSPELNTTISEITNRDGWCGGNALTLLVSGNGNYREVQSHDGDPYQSPVLQIDYDPSSVKWNENTCMRTKSTTTIAHATDDVIEDVTSGAVTADGDHVRTHVGDSAQVIGLRFTDVDVPAKAEITAAYLKLPLDSSVEGDVGLTIKVEDSSYSKAIDSAQKNALTNRTFLSKTVSWDSVSDSGSRLNSVNISSLVSSVVAKEGWTKNGAITFTLTPTSDGTGQRFFKAADSPSGAGASLVVHYQQDNTDLGNVAPVLATGRDEMIRTMMDYEYFGGTPLVDGYYESSQYMRGKAVTYGDQPASGNYTNPEFGECKTNQIVMLSDGAASDNNSESLIETLIDDPNDNIATSNNCANRTNSDEKCGIELAKWMYETDHHIPTDGVQPVVTHTIGFNISAQFLEDMATAGGGSYYEANSASDLTAAFNNIIQSAITQDTSFVAPSSSISLTNRLVNSNELYFTLFKPATTTLWAGNLKRFALASNSTSGDLEILDSLGLAATDTDGTIKSTAKTYWSANADGGEVAKGGAASNLTLTRTLYTSLYDNALSKTTLRTFHESNADIDKESLGIPALNDVYRTELMQWARGVDIKDYDGDTNITEIRQQLGDPMHSSPYIMHYPGEEPEDAGGTSDTGDTENAESEEDAEEPKPYSLIFFGTNHGFLHAINTENGTEEFAYIPEELLSNLDYFYRDEPAKHDERPYGLDGQVSGWHNDANGNGLVDGEEKAYIYVGMRRGGRNYYALDVTNPESPVFAWKIEGGIDNDFIELGQTWSRPVKAKVKYLDQQRDVLFFAAGYDDSNDDEIVRTADNVGRGFFMVDATTGKLLTSRDDGDFTDMDYSIPSDLRVIDPNGDGYADTVFVGDTGGQVWRFDIDNSAKSDSKFISGSVMARVSGTAESDNRKFFYEPDIALVKGQEGEMFLNIAIGSGARPGPNSTAVEDSFYSFRDINIFEPPRDKDREIKYRSTLTESKLINVSDELGSEDASNDFSSGWFFRLPASGEKSLSTALTVNNELAFTTYIPATPSDDICTATIGSGRVYTLDVQNGNPTSASDPLSMTVSDRYAELQQPGIPPRVTGLIVEAAPNKVSKFVGMEYIGDGGDNGAFERTFWAEQ